ncbi:MAG: hypothetical protein MO852_15995, partial [Candidatus Devosia euplotis]|nr:hypothetical protein [Candidatus Devosia euplotis]
MTLGDEQDEDRRAGATATPDSASSSSRSLMGVASGMMIFLIFAFQLSAIVYARFHETRYFCWAPFDIQTVYAIRVFDAQGRALSDAETRQRYRMPPSGVEQRSYQHIFNAIQLYETSYGKNDG